MTQLEDYIKLHFKISKQEFIDMNRFKTSYESHLSQPSHLGCNPMKTIIRNCQQMQGTKRLQQKIRDK